MRSKRTVTPSDRDRWPAGLVWRFIAAKAARIAGVGLVLGAVAAWLGLLSGGTPAAVGAAAARWYPLMVFGLPAALIVDTFSDLGRALATRRGAGSPTLTIAGTLIAIGVGGAVLGTAYFFVATFYVPTIFSLFKLDPIAIRAAVLVQFEWPMAGIVVAVSVAAALVETVALLIRTKQRGA